MKPSDGGYGPWSLWSVCSASCGDGFRQRIRVCDNPAPQNGGRDCTLSEGPSSEIEACIGQHVSFFVFQ